MDLIRFILVLACMAPLFILLAIRGVGVIAFEIYFPLFLSLAILPNLYLVIRMQRAKKLNDRKRVYVKNATDNREQLVTYLFAMLLPLYQAAVTTENDLYSALAAVLFVIFIFGKMELYYMNFFFSFFGYRILSIKADPASGDFSVAHVLITKKESISPTIEITPLRVTDFLLFDTEK